MDLSELTRHLPRRLVDLLLNGPAAEPIWAALCWLLLLVTRKRVFKFICRVVGLEDSRLVKGVSQRIDLPLKFLLILLALIPFVSLLAAPVAVELLRPAVFLAGFLFTHVVIQAADECVGHWHVARRNAPVPGVFRFAVLSLIYLAVVLLLMDWSLGVNVVPLLATSTVVTAVVGLALQDTLRNIFAGLTLTVERSVREGDWLLFRLSSNTPCVGQVVEIGWRSTKIRTIDNDIAIIPNVSLIQNEVVNYSSPTQTRGRVVLFPLDSAGDPQKVCALLAEAAGSVEGVLAEPAPQAAAKEFEGDRIVYQLRFWIGRFDKDEEITSNVISAAWRKLSQLAAAQGDPENKGKKQGPVMGDNIGPVSREDKS